MRLILASASPRRAALLGAAGFTFEVTAAGIDERARKGEAAAAYVRRLAAEKSAAVAAKLGRSPFAFEAQGSTLGARPDGTREMAILAADTAVVVDGEILGKPRGDADAVRMLRLLSGRRHEVMTGVSLRRAAREVGRVELTVVEFSPLDDAEIHWYISSGEGRDKAGAYAIQGLASRFIRRIDGSYSNVVGLPVACVHELLTALAIGADAAAGPGKSD